MDPYYGYGEWWYTGPDDPIDPTSAPAAVRDLEPEQAYLFDIEPFKNGGQTKPSVVSRALPRPREVQRAQQQLVPGINPYIRSNAQCRTYCGDFYEEAARSLLGDGFERLATDSHAEVCPDLQARNQEFFVEVKSIGKNKQGIVYSERLDNYATLLATWFPSLHDPSPVFDPNLIYVLWNHDVRTKEHTTLEGLRAALADRTRACYILDFVALRRMAAYSDEKVLNYRSAEGYERVDMRGHRLSSKVFRLIREDHYAARCLLGEVWLSRFWSAPLSVYGHRTSEVPTYVAVANPRPARLRGLLARLRAEGRRMYRDPLEKRPKRRAQSRKTR